MASISHLGSMGASGEQARSEVGGREHSSTDTNGLDEGLNRLKAAGFRLTPQRRAILEIFYGDAGHLTPQQVFNHLDESVPSLSLATVYNTLELFEEIGLVTRVTAHDGQTYFDPTVVPHHHAICDGCGEIFDVFLKPNALTELVVNSQASESDDAEFRVTEATVWLRGRCKSCQ